MVCPGRLLKAAEAQAEAQTVPFFTTKMFLSFSLHELEADNDRQ